MEPIAAIDQMLTNSGVSRNKFALSIGRKRQSVYNMFRDNSDVRMSTMLGACACAGYKMLLVSEDGDRIEVDLQPAGQEPEEESPEQ